MFGSMTHRADLLPLTVQLSFLIGLFEAPRLPAFRHLDAVLEGSPAWTESSVSRRVKLSLTAGLALASSKISVSSLPGSTEREEWPTLAEPLCCSCSPNIPPVCQSPSGQVDPSYYPETEPQLIGPLLRWNRAALHAEKWTYLVHLTVVHLLIAVHCQVIHPADKHWSERHRHGDTETAAGPHSGSYVAG